MELNEKIKNRMKRLGINNEELARRVGVSPSTISRYVTGEISSVRGNKIKKLADGLETTVDYLMGWQENNDYLGNHSLNLEYFQKDEELLHLYTDIVDNENLKLLFDKSRTLSPEDLEKVLVIINTFIKEEDAS